MTPAHVLFCSLLALSICGCGGGAGDTPPLANVSGVVSIDGQPAKDVIVTFTPVDGGRFSTGMTNESGRYSLIYSGQEMGAKIGKHKVTIAANTEYTEEELKNPKLDLTKPKGDIPKDYLAMVKDVEVTSGSNDINLTYP